MYTFVYMTHTFGFFWVFLGKVGECGEKWEIVSHLKLKIGKYKTSPENEGKKQGYTIGKKLHKTT